jgi:hypothetical protein
LAVSFILAQARASFKPSAARQGAAIAERVNELAEECLAVQARQVDGADEATVRSM